MSTESKMFPSAPADSQEPVPDMPVRTSPAPEVRVPGEQSSSARSSHWVKLVNLASRPISQAFLLSSFCKAIALFNWLFAIRLVMPYLGAERFGVVATVSSLGAFAALTDLGLGQALVNIAARAAARSEEDSGYLARATSCSFWGLAFVTGLLLTAVPGCLIAQKLFWRGGQAPPMLNGVLVLAVCMLAMQPLSVCTKLLTGFQEYILMYGWQLAGTLGAMLSVWVASLLRLNELWIIAALFAPPALALAGNTIHLFFFERPYLRPRLSLFQWEEAKKLISSGMTPFLASAASSVIFTAPVWCLSSLFGADVAGNYYVMFRLMSPLGVLSTMLTTPLWPAYAQSMALSRFAEMRRLLKLSLCIVVLLNLTGLGLLVMFLPRALALLTKGTLTNVPVLQASVTALLIFLMAIRQTLVMAVLGSARGIRTRVLFLVGIALSVGLPFVHGVLSHPYQVILLFVGLEICLNLAASFDLAGFTTAGTNG